MSVRVRHGKVSDLAFVGQDGYVSEETLRRKIEAREVILAERDGSPAAYLRLEYLWSDTPYISLIRVLEPFRGLGISRALLEYVEHDLRTRGHTYLYSSSQANEPEPQSWHRHVGFEECGFIAGLNEDGIGEVFFRKAL